eukprot:TRINITY_DN4647_c0_g1_i1.p1 TRINITY_DN4647_c0_g1~~TRINITY_DN4647_c0_g1_i1.p1  ORF type:complete len:578 (+),score=85.29 TRINITY_DN4647_c0_g1_i1:69-1802(+)
MWSLRIRRAPRSLFQLSLRAYESKVNVNITSSPPPPPEITRGPELSTKAVPFSNRCLLVILDGWGLRKEKKGNAILSTPTPTMTHLQSKHAFGQINASAFAVGLPKGVMGNSEVGHMTMGSGRIEFQDLVRISQSIEDGKLFSNKVLLESLNHAKKTSGRIHFCGLGSDAGVHTHLNHLYGLLNMSKKEGVSNAFVHFFADGRDTSPTSGVDYLKQVHQHLQHAQYGKLGTIIGRYYAMDRDKRWERTGLAYEALCEGRNATQLPNDSIDTISTCVRKRYAQKETDEFLKPIVVNKEGLIRDGDTVIFFNFRSDRMRQIVQALGLQKSQPLLFQSDIKRPNTYVVQLTEYNKLFPLPIVFPPQNMSNVLAEWLSKHGITQLHAAETEKYAHVTFFFNGKKEPPFPGEDRVLVSSPRVATYDLAPEMSTKGIAEQVVQAVSSKKYPYVMCNFAAPDMVGHTGMVDKVQQAIKCCDRELGNIWNSCKQNDYVMIVTADHGNAEEMFEKDGSVKTSHTTNPVPFVVADPRFDQGHVNESRFALARPVGGLCDVAPTILTVMGLEIPKEMSGKSMVVCRKS